MVPTTVGRILLREVLPPELGFERVNRQMDKGSLTDLVAECYQRAGKERTVELLEDLKALGFQYATQSGLSIGIDDMHIPMMKGSLIDEAQAQVVSTLRANTGRASSRTANVTTRLLTSGRKSPSGCPVRCSRNSSAKTSR